MDKKKRLVKLMTPNNKFSDNQLINYIIVLMIYLICPIFCYSEDFDIVYENDSISKQPEVESWLNDYIDNWETKNSQAIENCFLENPLLIVGAISNADSDKTRPLYYKINKGKQEFFKRVNIFFRSSRVDTEIDQIRIENHKKYDSVFGLNIHQNFSQTTHSDTHEVSEVVYSVWTYFIIDIKRPKDLQVIFSTVQSDEEYKCNGLLKLEEFNIQKDD